jgi:hypothetical protein
MRDTGQERLRQATMTHRHWTAGFFVFALFAGSGFLSAQSLGDIARQERAKRERVGHPPAKVWTNDNIPHVTRIEPPAPNPEATEPTAETTPPSATTEAPGPETPPAGTEPTESKQQSKGYWQEKFKSARAQLADAKERQSLAEDELSLLQTQEARELDPAAHQDLAAKVVAKSAEAEQARATTAKAQKALDDLQKEFDSSGAPAEWSKTD